MSLKTRWWVLDIETNKDGSFRLGCLMSSDGHARIYFDLDDLRGAVGRCRGYVFAHWGGGLDFLFFMPLANVARSGSSIISAQYGLAHLRDSWRLCPMPLAEIGSAVGIEKFAGKSDQIDKLTDGEVADHCENDCSILLALILQHIQWVQSFDGKPDEWPHTAGGTAVYAMESFEPSTVRHMTRHPLPFQDWYAMYDAVGAARTEISFIGAVQGVWGYDIRSSYPFSFLEAPIPVGPWRRVTKEARAPGVYFCDEIRQNRDLLPLVCKGGRWRHDGEGFLTSEEIAEIRKAGGHVSVEWGWVSSDVLPVGQDTVRHLFPYKAAGLPMGKATINALGGKFRQGLTFDIYNHTGQGYVRDSEIRSPQWYQQPLVNAFVIGRASIRQWKVLTSLLARGWRVYYTDTDNVHTDCSPKDFPGVIGLDCGNWKIEAENASALYIGPKCYALKFYDEKKDREKVKVVSRGVDPRMLTWAHMERAAAGEEIAVRESRGVLPFQVMASSGDWTVRPGEHGGTVKINLDGKERAFDGSLIYPAAD